MLTSLRRNNLGYQAFAALNDGNLNKFIELINRPDADLAITDHSDSRLQNLLGGAWVARSMEFGRYEDNTLLNCALSMERLDFVLELIKVHLKTGKDIGIHTLNNQSISPLEMALMVNCEYIQQYDSEHAHTPMRLLTESEQKETILKAREILAFLLSKSNADSTTILRAVTKDYRLPIHPLLLMDLIAFCMNQLDTNETKATKAIQFAIFEELYHLGEVTPLDVEIRTLDIHISETKFDVTESSGQLDNYHEQLPKLTKILEGLRELKKSTRSNIDKVREFVSLLKQDGKLDEILTDTLISPAIIGKNSHERYARISTDLSGLYLNSGGTPFIFDIVDKLSRLPEEYIRPAIELVGLLVTDDMRYLTNADNISLQDFIGRSFSLARSGAETYKKKETYKDTYKETYKEKPKTKSVERSYQAAQPKKHSTPKANHEHVRSYKFRGQMKSPYKGAKACSAVGFAMVSRLLRKDDAEFAKMLKDKDLVNMELNSCVLAGIDLNHTITNIDDGFFSSVKRVSTHKAAHEVYQILPSLTENKAGVKDVVELDDKMIKVNDVDGLFASLRDKYKDLSIDDVMFMATPENKTTVFFSRQSPEGVKKYYVINSSARTLAGTMEVHDDWHSAFKSLLSVWKNPDAVQISAYTLKGKLNGDVKKRDSYAGGQINLP